MQRWCSVNDQGNYIEIYEAAKMTTIEIKEMLFDIPLNKPVVACGCALDNKGALETTAGLLQPKSKRSSRSREFIILLLVSSIVAWPLTWYFLDSWIETFIYRTSIGSEPFVLATLLAGFIVVATTGFRAVKAALANPIDSLRDE